MVNIAGKDLNRSFIGFGGAWGLHAQSAPEDVPRRLTGSNQTSQESVALSHWASGLLRKC